MTFKNKKKLLKQQRNKERLQKLRGIYEPNGYLFFSSKSILKNEELHRSREDKIEKERKRIILEEWIKMMMEEEQYYINNKKDYYNPTQIYYKDSIYEYCACCGEICCCDDYDNYRTCFYTKGGILAPRPDGKCYCGDIRENCINYITYGTDCNGFGNIIFR
jgi:hypothetical protein